MNADEMFEEIDYIKDNETENLYCETIIPFKKQKNIEFDDVTKYLVTIRLTEYNEFGNLNFNCISLSIDEIQAIYKKCQELGWIE